MHDDTNAVFDPVLFSEEENQWLLEHLELPPVVALTKVTQGVNPRAIRPLLQRLQELDQIQNHQGVRWVGRDALKASIQNYLTQASKWRRDADRTKAAPRFPSLYSYDSRGRAFLGGPGSDSGRVRTYFTPEGKRVPFAVPFYDDTAPEWTPPTVVEEENFSSGLVVNKEANRIECFCGHAVNFNPDSRSSYRSARARISQHLRRASTEQMRHREIHTAEFSGASK